MKKLVSIIIMILSLFSISAIADDVLFTGTIGLKNGSTVNAEKIKWRMSLREGKVEMTTIDKIRVSVKPEDIASIYFEEVVERKREDYIQDGSQILVKLKNGKEALMTRISAKKYLYIDYLDSFTSELNKDKSYGIGGSSQSSTRDGEIIRMDFTGSGNVKVNASTNQTFPSNFNFDPYTGEKLQLKKK